MRSFLTDDVAPRPSAWWPMLRPRPAVPGRALDARHAEVRAAALAAAAEDGAFDPGAVAAVPAALLEALAAAWTTGELAPLAPRVHQRVLDGLGERRAALARAGLRPSARVLTPPVVRLAALRNRAGPERDLVAVHVAAETEELLTNRFGYRRGRADRNGRRRGPLREWWTLARVAAGWQLVRAEHDEAGAHLLADRVIAVPWEDPDVADAALAELVAGESGGALVATAHAGDGRAAALDASLADARFAPAVAERAGRAILAAWEDAARGDRAALDRLALPEAAAALLLEDAGEPRVLRVRGLRAERVRILAVHGDAIDVELAVRGRRELVDPESGAALVGSLTEDDAWTERWRLVLAEDPAPDALPWRLAGRLR